MKNVALLHGAGYAGGELIRLLAAHPLIHLTTVTSRTFAGQPVWAAHPVLRDQVDLVFDATLDDGVDVDAVLIAAEHGQGVNAVQALLAAGYEGAIVDLSADFRLKDAALYDAWYGYTHPATGLLASFAYGLPEVSPPYTTPYIANPGCFATGLTLALWPLAQHLPTLKAAVTALTGASGSGTRPKTTTHYPTRDGNVRAYKALRHQHLPEVLQALGPASEVAFVPTSGPFTRGIWGTAHVVLPDGVPADACTGWYLDAYADKPLVRCWPDALPELRYAAYTPFADIGWVREDDHLVVGFALDNLLKGAASQAIQNLNLVLGLPETMGLLPAHPQTQPA